MTLREQRAIVYPPNYNELLDEYLIYAPNKHTICIILSAIWGCIYYGSKCIYYSLKDINKKIIRKLTEIVYD